MTKEIRRIEMPVDGAGKKVALHVINEALAVTQYADVASGVEQDHALNAKTTFVIITIEGGPVKIKAANTATSADYDFYLVTGQYPMLIGNGVTDISFIANDSNADITIVEKEDV